MTASNAPRVRLTFLGTGTSHGVPMIGCDCEVCTSSDPRDRRTRASVVIESGGKSILVDTSPELRLQCVACGINHIDAVLFTHAHADHVTGMDDLRRFNWLINGPLRCYGTAATLTSIRRMFAYIFEDDPEYPSYKPSLTLIEIGSQPFDVDGLAITPIPLLHGNLPVLGFRVGRIAYCTDCSEIPDESWPLLGDLDVLVLDALRKRPHPTHFTVEQAIEAATRIGAKRTYFTHIAHALGHSATNLELPAGMELAFDGLVLDSTQ